MANNKIDNLITQRLIEHIINNDADPLQKRTYSVVNRVRDLINSIPGGMQNVNNVIAGSYVAKKTLDNDRNPILINEQEIIDVVDEFSATNTKYQQLIAIWNQYLRDKQQNEEVVGTGAISGSISQPAANNTTGIATIDLPLGMKIVKRNNVDQR